MADANSVTAALATLGATGWTINNAFTGSAAIFEQSASPLTGTVVQVATMNKGIDLLLTPAGALAALTVTLPSEANSFTGQRISIGTLQTITALTINGATTIYNAPTSMATGDFFVLKKVAPNIWAKEE